MNEKRQYYGNGLDQSDYLKNIPVLQDFHVIENDWKELFQWAMSIGRDIPLFNNENKKIKGTGITTLWDNQIFSILIEIAQINVESYKNTFMQNENAIQQDRYTSDLEGKIHSWIGRIEKFLNAKLQTGSLTNENLSVQVAQTIKNQFELSLQFLEQYRKTSADPNSRKNQFGGAQPYYNMLNIINEIGEKCDFYVKQIEDSEDMEPSLALFVTFVRNYSSIADRLNKLVTTLPTFYNNNIRRGRAQTAIQDVTELIITPEPGVEDSYILKNTAFLAGKKSDGTDLVYRAVEDTKISKIAIHEAYSICLKRKGDDNSEVASIHKKVIECLDPKIITPLFTDDSQSSSFTYAWMIESPMFFLQEGERDVTISMKLTDNSANDLDQYGFSDKNLSGAFKLLYSSENGWEELTPAVKYNVELKVLQISFSLQEGDLPTSLCDKTIHQCITSYPAIQLLLSNGDDFSYNWAILTEFVAVKITTNVKGITNLNLYSEVGELDATVPFYPFSAQAKQGSWFIVGNPEMAMKPLTNVVLNSTWNQLPYNTGFTEIYTDYSINPPITNQSFKIKTELKKGDRWCENVENSQELFKEIGRGLIDDNCVINFSINREQNLLNSEEKLSKSNNKFGLFRVTLTAPSIGFGTDEYRQLFAEVMTYNAKRKYRKQRILPQSPIVPIMSDLKLSYVAEQTIVLKQITGTEKTLFYRIDPLSNEKSLLNKSSLSQSLIRKIEPDCHLLLNLKNTINKNVFSVYFDLLPYNSDVCKNERIIARKPVLTSKYLEKTQWKPLELLDGTSGLTRSGYIKFTLTKQISENLLDEYGNFRLLIHVDGNVTKCLAVRNIYLNCITVKGDGGDGVSLPMGTIKQSLDKLPWINNIVQPFAGSNGKLPEDDKYFSARLSYRTANRNRAVNPSDYEQLVIERFPDIEKVHCIPYDGKGCVSRVYIIVFSRMQNELFPTTANWLLSEIKEYLALYTSTWVDIEVINPAYEPLKVECEFTPGDKEDIDTIIFRMNRRINNFFAIWMKDKTLPKINQTYSHKELRGILANDQGISSLNKLLVNGRKVEYINFDKDDIYIRGKYLWSIFIPDKNHAIKANAGIGISKAQIGINFKIK